MKCFAFAFLTFAFSFFSTGYCYQEDLRDTATGEAFPRSITIDHEGKTYELQATGVATRKKLIVKVYSIAHYLQDGSQSAGGDKFQEILQDGKAKQFTIKWVHDVEATRIQDGYKDSFKNVFSDAEQGQFKAQIDQYLSFFNQEAKKGDEHILRWLPGGYLEVIINGKKAGSITNKDFARGVWSIWFGPKSVVNRDNLVSLMK